MSYSSLPPALTRLTFGTGKVGSPTDPEHLRVTRAAMEAGLWFHTAHEYGGGSVFETLRTAFRAAPAEVPPCIFKVDGNSPELLRQTVETALRETGVARVEIAQICGNPDVSTLAPDGALAQEMERLRAAGHVGHYSLEIFADFSDNLQRAVQDELFGSVIFYYNTIERQVSNALFETLQDRQTPILALRTLGGHPDNYGDLDEAARAQLAAVFERSGCASRFDFRVRFALSAPQVVTTIAATSRVAHLEDLLRATREFEPLEAEIVAEIIALQSQWFAHQ